jgi:hypothetical protein
MTRDPSRPTERRTIHDSADSDEMVTPARHRRPRRRRLTDGSRIAHEGQATTLLVSLGLNLTGGWNRRRTPGGSAEEDAAA